MTEDQINAFAERFVVAFERIGTALEGIDGSYRRHLERLFPDKREYREAVVTRVPTEEDKAREAQGASSTPIAEWLADIEQEEENREDLGVREREWLEAHPDT